jgi:hypothetical protein
MSNPSPAKPTLLEELTSQFPDKIRMALLESLRRAKIQNPNDPILELMLVLGIWGKYYEAIPQRIKEAGDDVDQKVMQMINVLERQVLLLYNLSQTVQKAAAQFEGAPQAILDRFPAEKLAGSIAAKLDAQFQKLPLTQMEADLKTLRIAMTPLLGTPWNKGIAEQIKQSLDSLQLSTQRLADSGFVPKRGPVEMAVAASAALLTAAMVWGFVVAPMRDREPSMREISHVLREERFISQHVSAGINEQGMPIMIIPAAQIKSAQKDKAGNLTIDFVENR